MHVPICNPSGEQIDWPGVVQEPVEEPVEAAPEAAAGAALELDELSTGAAAVPEGAAAAADGDGATEGAAAATEGEAATAGAAADIEGAAPDAAAAGDDAAAAAPEAPELPALEALAEVPDAPHLGPVGGLKASALLALAISTEAPGSGNFTSAPSAVVQSVAGMFATNMSGNEAVARPASS